MSWPEIDTVSREKRYELKLTGSSVRDRLDNADGNLPDGIFNLTNLNFLEISSVGLEQLSENLVNLAHLTDLILCHNRLTQLPDVFAALVGLKSLNVAHNCLSSLPPSVGELIHVQSLDACNNLIETLPDFSRLESLHELDLSENRLSTFPTGLNNLQIVLQSVNLSNNSISTLPDIGQMAGLKFLNLFGNQLTSIPTSICYCSKLKELDLRENKPLICDRRLKKLIDQNRAKSILDYLSTLDNMSENGANKRKSKKKTKGSACANLEHAVEPAIKELDIGLHDRPTDRQTSISVIHFSRGAGYLVKFQNTATEVRPHIVCCVVHGVAFEQSNNSFKHFIDAQTKLHDSIGNKRQTGTIATHDLSAMTWPLVYEGRPRDEITITPLRHSKPLSATDLLKKLFTEAEADKKERKRRTLSGIYKYLEMVKAQEVFACLCDSTGLVISLPPLTNCQQTKMSQSSKAILLEVTSQQSQSNAKSIMVALLRELYVVLKNCSSTMVLEQVRVINDDNEQLKIVFPSRTDLCEIADQLGVPLDMSE